MEAALKHLQSLNTKFMTHQASAIFQQVTAVMERVVEIPPTSVKASRADQTDETIVHSIEFYRSWIGIRTRVGLPPFSSRLKSADDKGGRRLKGSRLPKGG